jgi:hypothetical protein
MQPAAVAQFDVFAKDAVRPDLATRADAGVRMNDGRGVDGAHAGKA